MLHRTSSACVVSASASASWELLAQQLRRRRLPPALQHEQDDLVSEALLRAIASPPPDGNWAPWVNRIFSNLASDRLRTATRATRAQAKAECVTTPCLTSPEDALLEQEQRQELQAALLSLPGPEHEAVQARFSDERHTPQTTAARVQVHRGIARLRALLCSLRALFIPLHAPVATATIAAVMLAQATFDRSPHAVPLVVVEANEARLPPSSAMAHATSRPRADAHETKREPVRHQPKASPEPDEPPARVFDFADDAVVGELESADVALVQVPLPSEHDSLLEIPASMVAQLLKSLEEI